MRRTRNPVYGYTVSRVRIPLAPPNTPFLGYFFVFFLGLTSSFSFQVRCPRVLPHSILKRAKAQFAWEASRSSTWLACLSIVQSKCFATALSCCERSNLMAHAQSYGRFVAPKYSGPWRQGRTRDLPSFKFTFFLLEIGIIGRNQKNENFPNTQSILIHVAYFIDLRVFMRIDSVRCCTSTNDFTAD